MKEPWHRVERLQHLVAWFDQWIMGVPHPEYGALSQGFSKRGNQMLNFQYVVLLIAALAFPTSAQQLSARQTVNAGCSAACDFDFDNVSIRNGWIQEGPPSQNITAAYMVIENHGDADLFLLSASTEVAEVVELHKMELSDGMMKMRRVESITIPAGGTAELKPGGYHLMVIGLKKQLKDGDQVSMTLHFSNNIEKLVTLPVKPRSAMVKDR